MQPYYLTSSLHHRMLALDEALIAPQMQPYYLTSSLHHRMLALDEALNRALKGKVLSKANDLAPIHVITVIKMLLRPISPSSPHKCSPTT